MNFKNWLKIKEAALVAGSSKKLPNLPDAQWWGAPGGSGSKGQRKGPIKKGEK